MEKRSDSDIAGESYWTSTWKSAPLPPPIDPADSSTNNRVTRHYHGAFSSLLASQAGAPRRLLEIGCARSVWLPYFAKYHGLAADGIDYSELGCSQAREILRAESVNGEIVCCDMFSPPPNLLGQYDVVVSFGVAEHFKDTAACIGAMAKFLRPGGQMITVIPNLTGLIGMAQRLADRSIYDIHVPLTKERLIAAHRASGLTVADSFYFVRTNFGVCNANGKVAGSWQWFWAKCFLRGLHTLSLPIIWYDNRSSGRTSSRMLASYVVCVAGKA